MSALRSMVEHVPNSAWAPCEVSVNSEELKSCWCPLVGFGEPRVALGLSADGERLWGEEVVGIATVYPLEAPAVVGVLPILERPLPMVRSEAARAVARLGLPLPLVDALPVTEIVGAALKTRSDYWVELALEWLEADADRQHLTDAITAASSDSRLAQRTRHRLQRLTAT